MGVKKGKVTRKYLKFYKIVFDINGPYHVILDGNFIFQALKYKIVIIDAVTPDFHVVMLPILGSQVSHSDATHYGIIVWEAWVIYTWNV